MIDGVSVTLVIPARSGSKGLPGKNTKVLGGRPLIDWTISSALKVRYADRVIVTSDDDLVLDRARVFGLEIIERDKALCTDETQASEVVLDTIARAGIEGIFTYLQPTSPFRSAIDVNAALELLVATEQQGVVSVSETRVVPEWLFRMGDRSTLSAVSGEEIPARRQDARTTFELNGAIFASEIATIRLSNRFLDMSLAGYRMARDKAIDIDTIEDWLEAENLIATGMIDETWL